MIHDNNNQPTDRPASYQEITLRSKCSKCVKLAFSNKLTTSSHITENEKKKLMVHIAWGIHIFFNESQMTMITKMKRKIKTDNLRQNPHTNTAHVISNDKICSDCFVIFAILVVSFAWAFVICSHNFIFILSILNSYVHRVPSCPIMP